MHDTDGYRLLLRDLSLLGACTDALVWQRKHRFASAQEAWDHCYHPEWLVWVLEASGAAGDARLVEIQAAYGAAQYAAALHFRGAYAAVDLRNKRIDGVKDAYASTLKALRDAYLCDLRAAFPHPPTLEDHDGHRDSDHHTHATQAGLSPALLPAAESRA